MATSPPSYTLTKTLLVIQFREDITLSHEQGLYKEFVAQQPENVSLRFVSFYDEPEILANPLTLLDNVSGVILGGSAGLCLVAHATNTSRATVRTIRQLLDPIIALCVDRQIPTLGICFGHQLLAQHFNGTVEFDTSRAETGILDIATLPTAQSDVLFSKLPHLFKAVLGHQDSVTSLPASGVILARTAACEIQAARYAPFVWGVQFHPELTFDSLVARLRLFPEYLEYAATLEPIETDEAALVLKQFLKITSKS